MFKITIPNSLLNLNSWPAKIFFICVLRKNIGCHHCFRIIIAYHHNRKYLKKNTFE